MTYHHLQKEYIMEIKFKSSENLDKRSLYKHTRGSSISLKDVADGTVIEPVEIVVFEDENSRGDTSLITSIIDAAGKHYTTNSKFFREELANIFNIFAPEPFSIIVRKQVSKAGRTFVTCELE